MKDPAIPGATFAQLTNKITLQNWKDPLNRIETFRFTDGLTLGLAGILARLGTDGVDTITWTETALAADFGVANDNVTTGAFNDVLVAGSGDDTLNGLGGTDTLHDGAGNDSLLGGDGTDHLAGDAGADILNGRTGFDYARYDTAAAGMIASLATPLDNTGEAAGDTYVAIEGLVGSAFNDILIGDGGNNTLFGNDTLDGGAGYDWLMGGAGAIGDKVHEIAAVWRELSNLPDALNVDALFDLPFARGDVPQIGSTSVGTSVGHESILDRLPRSGGRRQTA